MSKARRLREYRMLFERVADGEPAMREDYPENLGLRSKLGGEPDWDQGEDWPICPECKMPMVFVAQLDSMEHESEHNSHSVDAVHGDQHFMFGDVGMLYVFFCEECLETKSILQCG